MRGNNPLNIKQTGWVDGWDEETNRERCSVKPWKGSARALVDERGHAIFIAPRWGIRAAVRNLAVLYSSGQQTVEAILERWAPPDDTVGSIPGGAPNDPVEYADFVKWKMGIAQKPGQPLNLFCANGNVDDYNNLVRLIGAMWRFETRDKGPRWPVVLMGIALYLEDWAPGV